MAKEIKFGAEARAALETGVNKLADTILEDVNFEIHDHEKIATYGVVAGKR